MKTKVSLVRLIQEENCAGVYLNRQISQIRAIPEGKIRTLVVQNPCLDLGEAIQKMAEQNHKYIPASANSYVASEFNHDTQHTRKNNQGSEKMFSVYAIQFYCSLDSELLRK